MIRFWPLLVGVILLISGPALSAQEQLTRAQMEEDVRELVDVVRRTYAYVDEKKTDAGVDLDEILGHAQRQLDAVKSNADFHDVLKEMIAELKDGHCEVYAGHMVASKPQSWPFVVEATREGLVITVMHHFLARGPVALGDLVRQVNGRPLEKWVDDEARRISASSDGARRKIALRRMMATADDTVQVKVEHTDGTMTTVTLETVPEWGVPVGPEFAVGRVQADGVGYIRIPTFACSTPAFNVAQTDADRDAALKLARDQIDAAFATVTDTNAMILDLRGNQGGADLLGGYLISHFLEGDFMYYTTQTRSSPELRRLPGFTYLPKTDGWDEKRPWYPRRTIYTFFKGKPYPGHLVVLIDETCFSTTDCVLHALADLHPNVRFVGRPTNGGSGGPTVVARLRHSKADIQLCIMKVWSPRGRMIEGHGTRPNIPVEWTRDDVLTGRDPDLEEALETCAKEAAMSLAITRRWMVAGVAAGVLLVGAVMILARKRKCVE